MKDGKSVLLLLALIIFFVYVLRNFLGRVSSFFFVPIDSLLFISHSIPPVIMWMLFGLLIGIIYGSFIAIKKYKLDFKLLVYPIGVLVIILGLISLVSFIKNKPDKNYPENNSENTTNISNKSAKYSLANLIEFNEALKKGIQAVSEEEPKSAISYFTNAVRLNKNNTQLDSLAHIYLQIAKEKCESYKSNSQLKYLSNNYYNYAATLKNQIPEICN